MQGRWLQRQDATCGDIVIPMNDGDCMTFILGMTVAIRGVAERMDRLPASSGLHLCYREYSSRVDGFDQPWSPPRM